MQTILGSNGAIGKELAKVLPQYTDMIRLVSRSPQPVLGNEELIPADLLRKEAFNKLLAGSEIAYLTVGLEYSTKVWERDWPVLMRNTIDACIEHNVKLVFFDNIYMYDPRCLGNITEDCPMRPRSKKGNLRKMLVEMIQDARRDKGLQVLIARSADFYGPNIRNTSMLNESIIMPLSQGKTANWLGKLDTRHSFTFTPDAAAATALLGNTPEAYGEVWHLPTAPEPWTAREWMERAARHFNVSPKAREMPRWMVKFMGNFIPILREMPEMMYQFENDYIFNSSKFDQKFDLRATPYEQGLEMVLKNDYS